MGESRERKEVCAMAVNLEVGVCKVQNTKSIVMRGEGNSSVITEDGTSYFPVAV